MRLEGRVGGWGACGVKGGRGAEASAAAAAADFGLRLEAGPHWHSQGGIRVELEDFGWWEMR